MKSRFYEGKVILITGGAGSIGSELVKTILRLNPAVVRILDNNETALFNLEQELQSDKIRVFLGDIRDKDRLKRAFEDINVVFHAAALKHVPLCEYNPFEAIKTNVGGTQNLIEVAMDENIDQFITISTDKAVNPENVMGATKLLAERLTISANFYKGLKPIAFSCVRFGNVLDTRGSVVPLFRKQIQKGGPVTITDPQMTRFMMKIPRAVELMLKAAEMAQGGEIFILKMDAVSMIDLAQVMIEKLAPLYDHSPESIQLQEIGKRAGERLYEDLMTIDESERGWEDEEMFVVVPPPVTMVGNLSFDLPDRFVRTQKQEYSSRKVPLLTKEEIRTKLF
ncbi:MAG: polysaccharide biosynthesis protein [Theionarchaea archaeon]|nr:polysaccharide biosynthesis protein [Theionarchaea archaeon]